MKKLILILIIILATATSAQAEVKAKALVMGIESARTSQNWGIAIGLFRGVIQTHLTYQGLGIDRLKYNVNGKEKIWPRSCHPDKKTISGMSLEYVYWSKNSESFDPELSAVGSILVWLFLAYPCGDYY